MATITFDGLTKEYGDLTAVDGLDLEVEDGELLCLLGPSGCGKSTTLRMLGGLETPTEGDVYIDGERVTDVPAYERETSIVFQNWALFPHKTVLENVAFGPKMDGIGETERKERGRDVLEIVEMAEFEDHAPSELSGGQRQRVALARSLATEPEVLLLDEPLSNLDKRLREQMQLELKNIHEQVDATFIHVTHDQNEAFTLADRLSIMNDGRLVQVGDPYEVYDDPANQFIEEFLGDTNFVDAEVTEVTADTIIANTTFGVGIEVPITDTSIAPGDPLTLSFRPEIIEVDPLIHAGSNEQTRVIGDGSRASSLRGTVTDVLYRGSSVRFYVESGSDSIFFERSVGEELTLDVGDTVEITWSPEDLLLFSERERIKGGA